MEKVKLRSILLLVMDLVLAMLGIFIAGLIRFEFNIPNYMEQRFLIRYLPIVILVYFLIYKVLKVDKTIWDKVSIDETLKIVNANFIVTTILIILRLLNILSGFPFSILLISLMLIILLQLGVRIGYRYYRIATIRSIRKTDNSKRVLVYGAGNAGRMIAREILENETYKYNLIGFIDDDPVCKDQAIHSIPIFGGKKELPSVLDQYAIDAIFLAMPSISLNEQKKIIDELIKFKIDIHTVSSKDILSKNTDLKNTLRRIDIQDLLERDEIKINNKDINQILENKYILVTGAGGSIGSELVRQILKYEPKKIVMLDISERGLYEIQQEIGMKVLNGEYTQIDKEVIIGSIRDFQALENIFKKNKFDLVFHAAAHKHVPLMESVADEAVKNNIFGTKNLIDLSNKYNVERFINISTDKAVNPTNVMGATKRFNEMMLQSQNGNSNTKFVAVRFGNVLGSSGSAVPLFQKQIEAGGPVTVTHPDIERYFMTIPEAVRLVLQAASYAEGGEIFVLNMGDPVKIMHLAEKTIELCGYIPHEEIEIKITGLRPGEKLYEELFMEQEELRKTDNDWIQIAKPFIIDIAEIDKKLEVLKQSLNHSDNNYVIESLKIAVPTYRNDSL